MRPTGKILRRTRRRSRKSAREAFQLAFELVGGAEALAAWAREKPTDFYRLFARLIPLAGASAGEEGLKVEITRFSDPEASGEEEADADDPAA